MNVQQVDYDPFSAQPVDHDPFQPAPEENLKDILLEVLGTVLGKYAADTQGHIDRLAEIVTAPRKIIHDKSGRPVGVGVEIKKAS